MKVLFVFGGLPHYLNSLLRKICERGVEVKVILPHQNGATIGKGVKTVEADSFEIIRTEERSSLYGKKALRNLHTIIEAEKPDIFVIGWPYMLQIFFDRRIMKAIKRSKTKLVIREIPFQTPPYKGVDDYFNANPMYDEDMNLLSGGVIFRLKQKLLASIRKCIYSKADATLNYSTVAYDIITSYGVQKEKIFVTYNSTDTDELLSYNREIEEEKINSHKNNVQEGKKEKEILHIGRLVRWKKVHLLLEAFKILSQKHKDIRLVIVGGGTEKDNLMKQSAQLGVSDKVDFVGEIYDPKKLGRYIHRSYVYVLAGMGGLSINDAMAYGKPVVCSVCDGTEIDLVRNEVNGLFFQDDDASDLAMKLDKLISDEQMTKRMSEESERIIREEININTVTDRYIYAFNEILKS